MLLSQTLASGFAVLTLVLSACAPIQAPVGPAPAKSPAVAPESASITAVSPGTRCFDAMGNEFACGQKPPDQDPTEPITALGKSDVATIVNDPPCEWCEGDCPGSNCPTIVFDRVAAVVSGVRPGEQPYDLVPDCGRVTFKLEPELREPHFAASRNVICSCSRENIRCWLESWRQVYEKDPRQGIRLSDTMTVPQALDVLALFRAKRMTNAPEDLSESISGIYRNGSNFELDLDNCGEDALVRLETSKRKKTLRYLKGVHGSGCI